MKLVILSIAIMIAIAGCAPIQDTYKPLYQATPEKQEIEKR